MNQITFVVTLLCMGALVSGNPRWGANPWAPPPPNVWTGANLLRATPPPAVVAAQLAAVQAAIVATGTPPPPPTWAHPPPPAWVH